MLMKCVSTYLAGPIDVNKFQECKDWRNQIGKNLADMGIYAMNPLGNGGGDRISPELRQRLHNANILGDIDTIRDIVSNIIMPPDLDMVAGCSFLTLWIPEDNGYEICGSYGEITLARFLNKPVYIVTERKIKPCQLPNWAVGCSTEIFFSWEGYLNYVEKRWTVKPQLKELEEKIKSKDWLSKLKDEHKWKTI